MENQIKYDSVFKKLLEEFPDNTIIDLIDELFGQKHPHGTKVIRLATETHTDGKERRSDIMLRIGGEIYHAEIQSSDDSTIALRVFEYSYRAALQHGKTVEKDSLRLKFPKSTVFYLRSTPQTPREITVELELPDGKETSFKVPTKRLDEYAPQDLTRNGTVIFAPFYPMLYEKKLKSAAELENLKNDVFFLIDKMREKVETGEMSQKTAEIITGSMEDILENTMI